MKKIILTIGRLTMQNNYLLTWFKNARKKILTNPLGAFFFMLVVLSQGNLFSQVTRTSVQTGNWVDTNTWDCGCIPDLTDNVWISNTDTVTLSSGVKVNDFIIDAGGELATDTQSLNITGNVTINGKLSGTGIVILSGVGTTIDGVGSITNSGTLSLAAAKIILSSAILTKNIGVVSIDTGVVITNEGIITIGGNMIGAATSSTWINAANSSLNVGAQLLTTGTLDAMASGNTITYSNTTHQSIKMPNNSGQYCNLIFTNGGAKTAPAGTILVSGNWTNNSSLTNSFAHNSGTVEFNGTSIISGTAKTNFSKITFTGTATAPSGNMGCAGNWVNNGTFIHNNGSIIFNGTSTISGVSENTFKNITINNALTCPLANVNVEGNWTNNNTLFDNGGGTITFNGSAAQFIGGAQTSTYNNLTISNTGGDVTLSVVQFVSGYLYLNTGKIFASSLLTLNNTASSNEGSPTSFVDGAMKKIGDAAYVFPIGNNGKWARLAISAPSNPTTEFTAQYYATDHLLGTNVQTPLTSVSTLEYWTLTRAITTSDVTIELYWENATESLIDSCPTLTIAHWNGTIWVEEAAMRTDGSDCTPELAGSVLTDTVVTSFNTFTFGSRQIVNPLPIELVSFTATCSMGHADIIWSTAAEINNDYFTIERSIDAINWTEVHREKGAGNSNQLLSYHYADYNPAPSQSYYRLKQTDYNGTSETFSLVSLNSCSWSGGNAILVYPNPATDMIKIQVNANEDHTNTTIMIYDMMGRNVQNKIVNITEGGNEFTLENLNKNLPGNYLILIQSDGFIFPAQKIIIQK